MNILELAILKKMVGGGGGSGTDNYNDLSNLPQINGETLAGNKTAENLGLQDALTFDSAPTEGSTNPVESGGVYSELAKKQDKLTFNGTYDASTNKAATESTVTNAINELDVSETSFDADETIDTISETDGKIAVTKKDIAIASNQVTSMTGYTKPSSAPANPAIQTNDTANQAFGKLEFKADTNQTNILSVKAHTMRNHLSMTDGTYTATASGQKSVNIPLTPVTGNVVVCFGSITSTDTDGTQCCCVFKDASGTTIDTIRTNRGSNMSGQATLGSSIATLMELYPAYSYQQSSNDTVTWSNGMVIKKELYDIDPSYSAYSAPNSDLTYLEAEDRAALAEEIDAGAKQLAQGQNNSGSAGTATIQSDGYTVKLTGSAASSSSLSFATTGTIQKTGTYVFVIEASGTMDRISIWDNTTSASVETLYATGSKEVTLTAGHSYALFHYAGSAITLNATVKYMICTKAAFGVSQKFVPYRKNLDQLDSTKAPVLSTTTLENGSMNDIKTNSFMLCSSNVTDKPINSWGFLRTSVFNSQTIVQEFIALDPIDADAGKTFVRVMQAGSWKSWKALANT
jgi:hypothetical protein